jgi:hypothetical protein
MGIPGLPIRVPAERFHCKLVEDGGPLTTSGKGPQLQAEKEYEAALRLKFYGFE